MLGIYYKISLSDDTPTERFRGVFPLLLMIILSLLTGGCVTDSGVKCDYPLRLRFSYVFNREGRDLLKEEVGNLRLYLYDTETRDLVAMREVPVGLLDDDNSIIWNVPVGRHILVVWGGGERYVVEGADKGFLSHSITLPYTDTELGATVGQQRQHLWHSSLTDIVVNWDIAPLYDVELRKISNDVNVRVHVSGNPLTSQPECVVSSTNGRYNASGEVSAVAPLHYLPSVSEITPPENYDYSTLHEFTVLRLWASDDSHLTLKVEGSDKAVYDGSLTQLIDTLPHLDFGLDDTFDLDFYIHNGADGNASVEIRINNWKVAGYNVVLK